MRTMLRSAITIEKEYKMSIANKGQIMRRPTHPGEMLREDFLRDFRLTASELARAIGVSSQSVNELLRGRRAVRPTCLEWPRSSPQAYAIGANKNRVAQYGFPESAL